jgi:hypothetical protein
MFGAGASGVWDARLHSQSGLSVITLPLLLQKPDQRRHASADEEPEAKGEQHPGRRGPSALPVASVAQRDGGFDEREPGLDGGELLQDGVGDFTQGAEGSTVFAVVHFRSPYPRSQYHAGRQVCEVGPLHCNPAKTPRLGSVLVAPAWQLSLDGIALMPRPYPQLLNGCIGGSLGAGQPDGNARPGMGERGAARHGNSARSYAGEDGDWRRCRGVANHFIKIGHLTLN